MARKTKFDTVLAMTAIAGIAYLWHQRSAEKAAVEGLSAYRLANSQRNAPPPNNVVPFGASAVRVTPRWR